MNGQLSKSACFFFSNCSLPNSAIHCTTYIAKIWALSLRNRVPSGPKPRRRTPATVFLGPSRTGVSSLVIRWRNRSSLLPPSLAADTKLASQGSRRPAFATCPLPFWPPPHPQLSSSHRRPLLPRSAGVIMDPEDMVDLDRSEIASSRADELNRRALLFVLG